jgi:Uma2 family endonuclease
MAGLRMTAEGFFALGETDERLELIDGVTAVSPSPIPLHQMVVQGVAFQLFVFARGCTGKGMPAPSVLVDTDVRFDKRLVYRPDISVYTPGRLTDVPARLELPPDLIVEVLSESSRGLDLVTKRHDYERFGVGEYWVVDPESLEVRVWRRGADGAMNEASVTGDQLESAILQGFVLKIAEIR